MKQAAFQAVGKEVRAGLLRTEEGRNAKVYVVCTRVVRAAVSIKDDRTVTDEYAVSGWKLLKNEKRYYMSEMMC